jgi:hypothetical protein
MRRGIAKLNLPLFEIRIRSRFSGRDRAASSAVIAGLDPAIHLAP